MLSISASLKNASVSWLSVPSSLLLWTGVFQSNARRLWTIFWIKNVDLMHFASPEIVAKRKFMHTPKVTPFIWHENKSGNISTYPYSCALRTGINYNYHHVSDERLLTALNTERCFASKAFWMISRSLSPTARPENRRETPFLSFRK